MQLAYTLNVASVRKNSMNLDISTFQYDDLNLCKRFADELMRTLDDVLSVTIEGNEGIVFDWNKDQIFNTIDLNTTIGG